MLKFRCCFKLSRKVNYLTLNVMSVFTQKVNPITGKSEWELHPEDYDYQQEIASSAYADMLHDTERNIKYQIALEAAIKKFHARGKKAHVLDIGTGTGLLSMMAARAGADSIVACEAFQPMSKCAIEVIEENHFKGSIQVISKRSTDLKVGPGLDLEHRANILVTEVFDTELIGEGAIGTFKHAHEHLLEKDCIVIPSSATMYGQVVESDVISRWNRLQPIRNGKGEILLEPPPVIVNCSGSAAVHDLQLSQVDPADFKSIAPPLEVFKFDWSGKQPLPADEVTFTCFKAETDGKAHVVFIWWDLVMDTDGEVVLSCAPFWAHPNKPTDPNEIPWRDHWMQAVYYFPVEITVTRGEEYTLVSSHDEYSLWFNLTTADRIEKDLLNPICTCGLHVSLCRTRIGQLNCCRRAAQCIRALEQLVKNDTVCLCLGDFSLLGLVVARLGASQVYCIEKQKRICTLLDDYVRHNGLDSKVTVIDAENNEKAVEQINSKISLVIGEPHYNTSILPWQNIHFWYQKADFSTKLAEKCDTMPLSAIVRGVAVEFADLWKICAPLREVQGFTMTPFDKLIKNARSRATAPVNPEPLWEYPGRALSHTFDVLRLTPGTDIPLVSTKMEGVIAVEGLGKCHGVALWIDWKLDDSGDDFVTSGPLEEPQIGDWIQWDVHTRQGVFFLPDDCANTGSLLFDAKFNPKNGDIEFHFEFKR